MIAARTEVVNDVDEVAQVAVLVEPARGNAGGPQRVALQIGALRSICLRHPHVADQHAVRLD